MSINERNKLSLLFSAKLIISVIALVAAFVIVIVITNNEPGSVFADPSGEGLPTVQVSGAGSITVPADMATVTLGVSTTEQNPQNAAVRNNALMTDLLAALSDLGIAEADISTQRFSISQSWDHSMHWQYRLLGYEVTNNVSIIIRDLDMIGEVLGVGVGAGANISGGVQFGLDDSSPTYYEALELAIADATHKAKALAGALNTRVVGLKSVVETNTFAAPVFQREGAVAGARAALQADMSFDQFGVPIHASDITVTARVEVIYNLAP